jgi:hypothetical protein
MGVPYWLQVLIWPLIRDTDCYYCIFLRGMLLGVAVTLTIWGVTWAVLFQ